MLKLANFAVSLGLRLYPQGPFMGIRFFFENAVAWHLGVEGHRSRGLWIAGGETLLVHRVRGGEWLMPAVDAPHLISTLGRDLPGRWSGDDSATYAVPVSRFLVPASAAIRIAERFASSGARVDIGGSLSDRPLAPQSDLILAIVPGTKFAGVAILRDLKDAGGRLRGLAAEMEVPLYDCELDNLPGDPPDDEDEED
jgi:hypothetical protein